MVGDRSRKSRGGGAAEKDTKRKKTRCRVFDYWIGKVTTPAAIEEKVRR